MPAPLPTHTRRGFTLIELLVVVAIIALLISILLPSLSQARDAARQVKCAANQRQFSMANHMYADENENYFVPIKTAHGTRGAWYYIWWHENSYREMLGAQRWQDQYAWPEGLACPNAPSERINNGNIPRIYGFNRTGLPESGNWSDPAAVRRTGVVNPASKFQMLDGNDWHLYEGAGSYETHWDLTGELAWPDGPTSVTYRHDEGVNATHFDGHVSYYGKKEAYPDTAEERDHLWPVYLDPS